MFTVLSITFIFCRLSCRIYDADQPSFEANALVPLITPLKLANMNIRHTVPSSDNAELLDLEANALKIPLMIPENVSGRPPRLEEGLVFIDEAVVVDETVLRGSRAVTPPALLTHTPERDHPADTARRLIKAAISRLCRCLNPLIMRNSYRVAPKARRSQTGPSCVQPTASDPADPSILLSLHSPTRGASASNLTPIQEVVRRVEDRVAPAARRSQTGISYLLPNSADPADPCFLLSLHSPTRDAGRINPVHVAVRRDVLEVRRTMSGKIFFQCGCCKHLPRNERARLSTFAPRNVGTIYRSFTRFMMEHVSVCEHIPEDIKRMNAKWSALRMTGDEDHWTKSMVEDGFRNSDRNFVYKV